MHGILYSVLTDVQDLNLLFSIQVNIHKHMPPDSDCFVYMKYNIEFFKPSKMVVSLLYNHRSLPTIPVSNFIHKAFKGLNNHFVEN